MYASFGGSNRILYKVDKRQFGGSSRILQKVGKMLLFPILTLFYGSNLCHLKLKTKQKQKQWQQVWE